MLNFPDGKGFHFILTLQDALEILKLQVINKDILTYDLTKQDYHLEENSLYRSDSFCVILVKSVLSAIYFEW